MHTLIRRKKNNTGQSVTFAAISDVENFVAAQFNVDVKKLYERNRSHDVLRARAVVFYILRKVFRMKYIDISRIYKRAESTVIESVSSERTFGISVNITREFLEKWPGTKPPQN